MSSPIPPRQRAAEIANPFHRRGFYALPHAVLIGIIVAVLLILGAVTGYWVSNHMSVNEVEQKYGHSLRVFKIPPPRPVSKVPHLTSIPVAATINLQRYPGVGDQGTVGSCAAWSAAWAASYEYRLQHPKSSLRFSPRWMYDWFSQGNGDNGSYVGADLSVFPTKGVPRNLQFRYPPWSVDWPVPAVDNYGHDLNADAARYRMPVQVLNAGVGYAGVQFAKSEIAQGHPAMLAIPVYDSFERSTGTVDVPGPNETLHGGHEIVGVQYDDNYRFPSGAIGGIRIQNQWTTGWADHGDAWLSYQFLAEYGYAFNGIRLGGTPISGPVSSTASPAAFPQHKTFPPPPLPKSTKATRGGGYWLSSRAPYASLVNAAGKRYSISPLGMEATFGTESNINPRAYRYTSYYDHSCGLSQITIPTARGYGLTGTDDQICNWLFVPSNTISLTARMFRDFKNHVCWSFSPLYASWNLGPGYGCKALIYKYPTNPITQQALHNWYDWRTFIRAKYG